jgi:hypothetical protein
MQEKMHAINIGTCTGKYLAPIHITISISSPSHETIQFFHLGTRYDETIRRLKKLGLYQS